MELALTEEKNSKIKKEIVQTRRKERKGNENSVVEG